MPRVFSLADAVEILHRDRIEQRLKTELAAILDEWRRKLRPAETGQPPAEEEERKLALLLLLLLLPIWEDAAEQLLEAGGLQPGRRVVGSPAEPRVIFAPSQSEIRIDAVLGAQGQARTAAQQIVANTRNRLNEAFGAVLSNDLTEAEFQALLDKLFGAERAESISITETTRARTGGFENGRGYFAERGLPLLAVWQVTKDERLCKVCRPLHGQPESAWKLSFPDGPPAHPRCRCTLAMVARDGTELN